MNVSSILAVATLLVAVAPLFAGETLQVEDLPSVAVRPTAPHAPVEIVKDGRPVAVVYVAEANPSDTLKRLLKEFDTVMELTAGARLQKVEACPPPDVSAIIIGDCPESRRAGINAEEIPIEGFVVKTAPNRVYLVGSKHPIPPNAGYSDSYGNEGTAWAVADFLERFVGVRWYWPLDLGGRSVIKKSTIAIPPAYYSDQPEFRKREFFPPRYRKPWWSKWYDKDGGPVPSAMAIPPDMDTIDMMPLLACLRSGNSWPYMIKVHQPQHFASNPAKWKAHSAMFQKNPDGSPNYRMLCYSSQEAFDYLIQGCEDAWTNGKPLGAVPWVTTTCVTISPGDYVVRCYCDKCKSLFQPELAPYGTASKIMGLFVKKFCEEVKRRWPEKKVLFLPYWNYTLCPEDIDFPDNLEIQMCTMAFGLMRQPGPRKLMQDNLRAWSRKVGGRVTTWEYSHRLPDWTHAPYQCPHLVQDYYRSLRDVLAGSFLNGGGISEWSQSAPTDYCWMRIMWDPDVNVDAILDNMCERMFGKAAATTRELLHLMCDRWEKAEWHSGLGDAGRITPRVFADTWPPEVVERMAKLWRQARRELKDDPSGLQRFEYWTWTFEAFLKEAEEQWAKAGVKPAN